MTFGSAVLAVQGKAACDVEGGLVGVVWDVYVILLGGALRGQPA